MQMELAAAGGGPLAAYPAGSYLLHLGVPCLWLPGPCGQHRRQLPLTRCKPGERQAAGNHRWHLEPNLKLLGDFFFFCLDLSHSVERGWWAGADAIWCGVGRESQLEGCRSLRATQGNMNLQRLQWSRGFWCLPCKLLFHPLRTPFPWPRGAITAHPELPGPGAWGSCLLSEALGQTPP